MKERLKTLAILSIPVLILVCIGGCITLDYKAYKQRFPEAAWWTYIFKK